MYTIPPQNKGHQTLPAVSKQLFYHSAVVFSKKPATPSPCCEFLTVTFVGAQDLDHRSFYQLLHGLHHLEGTQMEARSWGPWNDKTVFWGVRFSRWSCFNNRYMIYVCYDILLMVQQAGKLTSWGKGSLSRYLQGLDYIPAGVSVYMYIYKIYKWARIGDMFVRITT